MFKNTLLSLALAVSLSASLMACGPEQVPQDIVDQNQTITRLNAQKNADAYRLTVYPDSGRALMQSDSTVSKNCRYGDGWASGSVQFFEGPNAGKQVKIKCQTNGSGKGINGCMTDQEFQTKTYKDEDGVCQGMQSLEKFK
ncbi:hypothetical protein UFOVP273_53 [uncultured Caudovirales phage]|uniref:Lipoprotein n=1 Tax=uncultured Caudovirales phage TaxID=2100421 RepID=A0A6J5LRS1_9CAUD|nr:hypothetical protein UFOVP273_53 [uncultured Caudovirales phage]